jgi:two-component system phosphate regulon sensor histidine kinase PhoR
MDKTLARQLTRIFGSPEEIPAEYDALIKVVNQTYIDFQGEYKLMERSLDISSSELTELNSQLLKEAEIIEKTVATRTQELDHERAKLSKIAEYMRTGAMLLNKSGEVIFLNRPARNFLDFQEEGYDGSLEKLYTTFSDQPLRDYVAQCGQNLSMEIDNIEVGKSIFHILLQGVSDEKDFSGLLVWINDVTQEKRLERSKSELVAVASHQLRTPLTVTKGNTEILLDQSYGPLNEEQRDIIVQTHASNENMIDLVNQMLDITKIEQGKFSFPMSDVSIIDVLTQAVSDMTPHATKKNIAILYTPPEIGLPILKAEETRLYQIFQNLIDNAIKYSQIEKPESSITVIASIDGNILSISIKDEGIGIPVKDQSSLFGRFYRASNAEKSFIDGTGLGLYVVQSIVHLFKGEIYFVSKENEGTTFTVEFPVTLKD